MEAKHIFRKIFIIFMSTCYSFSLVVYIFISFNRILYACLPFLASHFYLSLFQKMILFSHSLLLQRFVFFSLAIQSLPYNHWSLHEKKKQQKWRRKWMHISNNGTKVQTNRNQVTFATYNFKNSSQHTHNG